VVIGVTVNGERDILGLWAGDGSEGAEQRVKACVRSHVKSVDRHSTR
jgi:transposase-like protein